MKFERSSNEVAEAMSRGWRTVPRKLPAVALSKQDVLSPDGDRLASKCAEKPGMATASVIAITREQSRKGISLS